MKSLELHLVIEHYLLFTYEMLHVWKLGHVLPGHVQNRNIYSTDSCLYSQTLKLYHDTHVISRRPGPCTGLICTVYTICNSHDFLILHCYVSYFSFSSGELQDTILVIPLGELRTCPDLNNCVMSVCILH